MNTAKVKTALCMPHTIKCGETLAEFLGLHRDTPVCELPARLGVTRYHDRIHVEFRP